jgi:hypothetical protein
MGNVLGSSGRVVDDVFDVCDDHGVTNKSNRYLVLGGGR